MDRRFLLLQFVCLLTLSGAVLLALGCAKENGAQADRAAAGSSPETTSSAQADNVAETHRPVIEEPSHDPGAAQPGSAFVPDTIAPPPEAPLFPRAAAPEDSGEPAFPAASEHEFNPLRIGASPPAEPNPLRSFAPVPRMRAPAEFAPEAAAEAPPEFAPAIVGSAPPAAAADPEFPSAAIEPASGVPAAGSAATGPAAPIASPQPLAATTSPFEVVQVFYGTDRAAIDPTAGGWMTHVMRFVPTGFAALVTLCLLAIAASKRSTALWVVSAVGVIVCVGLGYQAAANTLFAIRWDGKQGPQYTINRSPDGEVQLGVCEVTIPRSHDPGELETPSILRLEVRDDAKQHVVLSKTEPLAGAAFYELLRQRVQASPRKELFVFIHGFDTQFEDAARRTAQIHYDLKFQGAPVFFSWPANNKSILTYPADENTIGWSAPHLKQFLLEIVQQSDAESINLIAHSMGNRALSIALREIELEFRGDSRLFHHVVLAAPDIDADEFRKHIAPAMQRTAHHVTLYASSRDDALRVSQLLHRGARAGDSGRGLVVLPGMDTIDVTAIDTSPWGHIYLGSSDPVLQDLKYLFLYGFPPQERRWLSPAQREGLTYWIFEASQTASRSGLAPH